MMILNKDFEQNISMFQNTKSEVRLWLEIIGNVILVQTLQCVPFKTTHILKNQIKFTICYTSRLICAIADFSSKLLSAFLVCNTSRKIRTIVNFGNKLLHEISLCNTSREIRAIVNFSNKLLHEITVCNTSR